MQPSLHLRKMLAVLATTGLMAGVASAQYVGPSQINQPTVASILEKPIDEQYVQIQGHLLAKQSDEKYVFSDGTGKIIAEIDSKRFKGLPSIDDKTRVELIGEVDTGFGRAPEIEVDELRVVKP